MLAALTVVIGLCVVAFDPWESASSTSGSSTTLATEDTPQLAAWHTSAPYVFVTDPKTPDLVEVLEATGQKAFTLAFVRAPASGGCTPTWGGTDPVSKDTRVAAVIRELRAHGGDVAVSFGGGAGTALGLECDSPQATADAYQTVLDKYGIQVVDLDIERTVSQNPAAVANEIGAARILQRENPGLVVTLTVPGTATGVDALGERTLTRARDEGLEVAAYTLMPFDGEFRGAAAQQAALKGFNRQLRTLFGWSAEEAWRHTGISQMNGLTDLGEYFSEVDFASNLIFAKSHHMARFTFWSLNRDRQCTPADNNMQLSTECSSIAQSAYAFTRYSTDFAKWAAAR
ncbi:chitinase [Streptomyces sp. NPDC051940]|uniref:chitinase n=1 Tax=Streptomyces sp. NPDC051940 TaxID=3155675 RepID=UPI00341F831C